MDALKACLINFFLIVLLISIRISFLLTMYFTIDNSLLRAWREKKRITEKKEKEILLKDNGNQPVNKVVVGSQFMKDRQNEDPRMVILGFRKVP